VQIALDVSGAHDEIEVVAADHAAAITAFDDLWQVVRQHVDFGCDFEHRAEREIRAARGVAEKRLIAVRHDAAAVDAAGVRGVHGYAHGEHHGCDHSQEILPSQQ